MKATPSVRPGTVPAMNRRSVLRIMTLPALVLSRAARGQSSARAYRIGFLATAAQPIHEGLREGLRGLGWVEHRDFVLITRYSDPSTMQEGAAELVAMPVDVLVCATNFAALPARRVAQDIPIVAVVSHDPVGVGLAKSLSRPGGNVTGIDSLSPGLDAKRLELLQQMLPGLKRMAVITTDECVRAVAPRSRECRRGTIGYQNTRCLRYASAASSGAFSNHLSRRQRPDGVFWFSPIHCCLASVMRICALATTARLPTAFEFKEFASAGGLLSYGADLRDMYRRAAYYVYRIAKGASPADLPIEQPTKFELVLNLKTARMLWSYYPAGVAGEGRPNHRIDMADLIETPKQRPCS